MAFYTVRVTPTTGTNEVVNGEVIIDMAEIQGAVPIGGGALLRSITIVDYDDAGNPLDLYFFQRNTDSSGTALKMAVDPVAGADNAVIDWTDANMVSAKHLGHLGGVKTTTGSGVGDFVLHQAGFNADVNVPVMHDKSHNDTGSIYFSVVATATETKTASSLEFIFGFES